MIAAQQERVQCTQAAGRGVQRSKRRGVLYHRRRTGFMPACILAQRFHACGLRRRDHDAAEQHMRNTRALKEGASDDLTTLAKQVPASLCCMPGPAGWHASHAAPQLVGPAVAAQLCKRAGA